MAQRCVTKEIAGSPCRLTSSRDASLSSSPTTKFYPRPTQIKSPTEPHRATPTQVPTGLVPIPLHGLFVFVSFRDIAAALKNVARRLPASFRGLTSLLDFVLHAQSRTATSSLALHHIGLHMKAIYPASGASIPLLQVRCCACPWLLCAVIAFFATSQPALRQPSRRPRQPSSLSSSSSSHRCSSLHLHDFNALTFVCRRKIGALPFSASSERESECVRCWIPSCVGCERECLVGPSTTQADRP